MRLYYNTNGLAHHRLDDAIDLLASLGYDGVALTPDVHHLDPLRCTAGDVQRVRERLRSAGLGVTIEGGARFVLDPRRKHWPNLTTAEGHARRQDFYRRLVDLAAELGSPLVSIWSGTPDAGDTDAHLDALAARLEPVLDHAAAAGVRICFEPEPGMLVDRLERYGRLVERCGDRLALTIDLGHLAAVESPPWDAHLLRWKDRLAYVQADDAPRGRHEHLLFGEGALDFDALARALQAIDYRGIVAVELSRHSHVAPEAAAAARAFLRDAGF